MYNKEYISETRFVMTEYQVDDYIFSLQSYYFLSIKHNDSYISFNTKSSRESIDFFNTLKETDYDDFGDVYLTYDNKVLRWYRKPSYKLYKGDNFRDEQETFNKENGKLELELDNKYFNNIINFLKEEQVLCDGFGLNNEELEKRFNLRQRKYKLERICQEK